MMRHDKACCSRKSRSISRLAQSSPEGQNLKSWVMVAAVVAGRALFVAPRDARDLPGGLLDAAHGVVLGIGDVDHHAGHQLREDPLVQRQGELIAEQAQGQLLQRDARPGLTPLGQHEGQPEHQPGKDEDRPGEAQQAEPGGPHGHQLLVERQAAEGRDRGDDAGDREGEDQERRQEVQEDLHHRPDADAFRDQQLHEAQQLLRQHD